MNFSSSKAVVIVAASALILSAMALFCAVGPVGVGAGQARNAPAPAQLPFQGRLLRPTGESVPPGAVVALFSIYPTLTGGDATWSSGPIQIAVRKGGFMSVLLGDGEHPLDGVDFTQILYVGVRVDDPNNAESLANEPEMLPRILITPGVYSHQAGVLGGSPEGFFANSVDIVPIGTVTAWFGNPAELRESWLICNGQTVEDPESPLTGQQVPDLRNSFVRGEGISQRDLLSSSLGMGGAETANVGIPDHTHGVNIAEAGEHAHSELAAGEHQHQTTVVGDGPLAAGINPDAPFGRRGSVTRQFFGFTVFTGVRLEPYHLTSADGGHTHSIAAAGNHSHGASVDTAGDSQQVIGILPPYQSLHYIIRVK